MSGFSVDRRHCCVNVQAVYEKMRSFHSRQSLPRTTETSRVIEPIREESKEAISTRERTLSIVEDEQVIGIQSPAERDSVPGMIPSEADDPMRQASDEKASTDGQEDMRREKSLADAILSMLHVADDGKEEQRESSVKAAGRLEQAADELNNYAALVTIQVGDNLPLSAPAILAASNMVIDLLHRAIDNKLHEFLARHAASKSEVYQIQRADAIVSRLLNKAACAACRKKTIEGVEPLWTEKALHAAILLVENILSVAIVYAGLGEHARIPDSVHVWTASAISAACQMIRHVATDAALQASATPTDQATTRRYSGQQGITCTTYRQVLEEHLLAMLDTATRQPSAVGLAPSPPPGQ